MFTTNNSPPGIVVINNFYKDVDQVRKRALDTPKYESKWWKGRRSNMIPTEEIEPLRPVFEKALGISLDNYHIRSHFHIHEKDTPIVYHKDQQQWAAVLYLCPDAPIDAGTSIWKHNNQKGVPGTNPIIDGSWWDEQDRVGNVYNRCIIFNARQDHSVSQYFGETDENKRLVQLFFFDNK